MRCDTVVVAYNRQIPFEVLFRKRHIGIDPNELISFSQKYQCHTMHYGAWRTPESPCGGECQKNGLSGLFPTSGLGTFGSNSDIFDTKPLFRFRKFLRVECPKS